MPHSQGFCPPACSAQPTSGGLQARASRWGWMAEGEEPVSPEPMFPNTDILERDLNPKISYSSR